MRRRRLLRIAVAGVIATVAAVAGMVVSGPSASATQRWGTLVFDKNPKDPTNSQLRLEVWESNNDGSGAKIVASRTMRAGSGYGSTDDCAKGKGWLPNGAYPMRMYWNYAGSVIKGYAFRLPDKVCSKGTATRVDLFIHTESGARNVQCGDGAGDQACRWEYPTVNDYLSYGCIKLAPADIRALYKTVQAYFGTSGSGGSMPFKLKVIS
jgi:hypothetical protein